jgi:gluconolactonase
VIDIVADGLDHPECVAFGPDGSLFAGGEAGQLYRIDMDSGRVEVVGTTDGWLLGLAVDGAGRVVACDPKLGAVVEFEPDGSFRKLSEGTVDRPMKIPNFPVFAEDGTLYVSDSGRWPEGGGCVYKIDSQGATTVWSTASPQFTNGLAIDPAGEWLYVAESTLPGITRISLTNPEHVELVVSLPGTVPDGLAFDVDGTLYIGCYRPDRIYTLDRAGTLLTLRDDFQGTDLAAPTNIAFGGDGCDLVIASLARWHIARIRVERPGAPLRYPARRGVS